MNIEFREVTKKYANAIAVDAISFRVERGEIVGYLGPNGAGKSTTIKMLAGILAPSQGLITVDGSDARTESLSIKQRLGYVPETGGVYESLTGLEFLEFTARLYHLKESLISSRSRELLRLFGLSDVMNRRLSSYSKGMKQKVLICSALIHNPDLICLDEPLSGLDVNAALVLKSLLRTLAQQGKTVFYCSHVLDVVERLCTRVIIIDHGKIVADAPVARLKELTNQQSLEQVFQQLTNSNNADEIAAEMSAVIMEE